MTEHLDSIALRGIRVFAYHGVLPEERREGQEFLVDVTMRLDVAEAAHRDDLSATIDYAELARAVHDRVAGERWNLLERVAQRVAELVMEDPRVTEAEVAVHKPGAPVPVEVADVVVTVRRPR